MARRSDDPMPPRPERVAAFRVGLSAESRAAAYLIAKGYRIVARRFSSAVGEVDIVARRGRVLVFAEVKAREHARRRRLVGAAAPAAPRRRRRRRMARRASGRRAVPHPVRCRAGGAGPYAAPHRGSVRGGVGGGKRCFFIAVLRVSSPSYIRR